MVHCLPLITLFATHLSYSLILNPILHRDDEYNSYHKNADLRHLYNARRTLTYRHFIFFPFLWSCISHDFYIQD